MYTTHTTLHYTRVNPPLAQQLWAPLSSVSPSLGAVVGAVLVLALEAVDRLPSPSDRQSSGPLKATGSPAGGRTGPETSPRWPG